MREIYVLNLNHPVMILPDFFLRPPWSPSKSSSNLPALPPRYISSLGSYLITSSIFFISPLHSKLTDILYFFSAISVTYDIFDLDITPISKYIYAQNWQNQSQGWNEAEGIADASAAVEFVITL